MRIVVIDSERVTGELLDFVLTQSGHEVALVTTAADGLREVTNQETATVLLQDNLPDMDGCRFCMELRARRYNGPVIFISRRDTTRDKVRAFDHGADDYIVEPYDPQELIARVDAVARRCRQTDYQALGTVLKVGDVELSLGTLMVRVGERTPIALTPTEMRMLECLMRNSQITIGRERLIERTWGYDFLGESNRVDVYISRLRKKIERDPANPDYLHTVRGIGYVFRPAARLVEEEERVPVPLFQASADAMPALEPLFGSQGI